jgi:protein-tyrosine phosphatase
MGEAPPRQDRFAVLAVCTGNIGRSPIMERVLLDRFGAHGVAPDVQVRSAGTHAMIGAGMEDGARLALLELGISPEEFGATPLQPRLVETADLVVVATREHRAEVVGLAPQAVRRTFTLHELGRIAATCPPMPPPVPDSGPGWMRGAVAWAAQLRGSVPRPDPLSLDDLEDALGEPLAVYRSRAAEVVASVERIVPYLLGNDHAG